MNTRKTIWMTLIALALWVSVPAPGATKESSGRVEEVTVYRGQAMVTRVVPADLPEGPSEIVVPDLPEQVVSDSVFATAGDGVEVRAVRYRSRAIRQAQRDEVRKLEQKIEDLQDEIDSLDMDEEVVEAAIEYLDKLENFVAPTAQAELTKGVLDADTLEKLTHFILKERKDSSDRLVEVRHQTEDLKKELELAQRRLRELTAGASRTLREAVLFLEAEREMAAEVKLSYLVQQAGWDPSYNVRGGSASDAVEVEYNAAIHQVSGEAWEDVKLTLSTASPVLTAEPPTLAPFWVELSPQQQQQAADRRRLGEQYQQFRGQVRQQARQRQAAARAEQGQQAAWSMNYFANNLQAMEMMAGKELIKTSQAAEKEVEGLSVTYHLPGRISLDSRADTQMVRVGKLELKSRFYHVAMPVLTSYVYREAEITNDSELALLEGPASMYLDDDFVGKSTLPMVATAQQFNMGFGLDPALRASRELVDREEQTMGANREITFTYRLRLENFREEPVEVRLYDRLPQARGGRDMRVTLGEMSDKLCDDPLYLEMERPRGILCWNITVPAGASGANARRVEYSYTVEFDRQLSIATPDKGPGQPSQELQREFEELQRMKRKAH